jgi:hypothetical protein
MSFICPEDILKRREQYMFDEFVRQWDMRKSMDKFAEFLNFSVQAQPERGDRVFGLQRVREGGGETDKGRVSSMDDYKNFMDKNEERMTGVQPQERVQDERARHQEPREFLQGGGGDEETPREGPTTFTCVLQVWCPST